MQDFHQVAPLGDGRGVVYVVHRTEGMDTIAVLSGRTPKTVLQVPGTSLSDPAYSSTGHLIYGVGAWPEGALWAVPFDVDRLETTGDPFLVSEQGSQPSVSADGTLVHYAPDAGVNTRVVRVDRSGTVVEAFDAPGIGHTSPTFSPDGRRLALSASVDGNIDLWVLEVASGTPQRLTFDPSAEVLALEAVRQQDAGVCVAGIVGRHALQQANGVLPIPALAVQGGGAPCLAVRLV